MVFKDRKEAGQLLAEKLKSEQIKNPFIFGIPRGGVVVAAEIAQELKVPFDAVICRKLGVPVHPELGFGAIADDRIIVLNDALIKSIKITPDTIKAVKHAEEMELARRIELFRKGKKMPDISKNNAIIVDDGIATGVTVKAAIAYLRTLNPLSIIVAAPVCAKDSYDEIKGIADREICLSVSENFYAVGQFYQDFPQTTDEEVKNILNPEEKENL